MNDIRPPLRFGVAYDFRNPAGFDGLTSPELYAQILDQAALVDSLGFDQIWLTEHHFVADGYLPSFVAAAGAIAFYAGCPAVWHGWQQRQADIGVGVARGTFRRSR